MLAKSFTDSPMLPNLVSNTKARHEPQACTKCTQSFCARSEDRVTCLTKRQAARGIDARLDGSLSVSVE